MTAPVEMTKGSVTLPGKWVIAFIKIDRGAPAVSWDFVRTEGDDGLLRTQYFHRVDCGGTGRRDSGGDHGGGQDDGRGGDQGDRARHLCVCDVPGYHACEDETHAQAYGYSDCSHHEAFAKNI